MSPTHAYCDECGQQSAIDGSGRCLWCEGPTRKARGGGKPAGKYGKLTDEHLRALHLAHLRGTSARELGRQVYERMGFASPQSCSEAMRMGWRRLALPTRQRVDAIRLANRGRAAADSPGTADRATYKRWLRARGGGQRPCQGVKETFPDKGRPCHGWAMVDSDYCFGHDPRFAEVRDSVLRDARATADAGRAGLTGGDSA